MITQKLPHFYASVEGWAGFLPLYDQAVAEAEDGDYFAEIGNWYGRSAAYLAVEMHNSGKDLHLYCVDHGIGNRDVPQLMTYVQQRGGSTIPAFLAHMERGGVAHLITQIPMDSVAAAAQFADASLAMVMIDGDHSYAAVKADVRAWLPKVKPGGMLAGDDATWTEVLLGVYETLPVSEVALVNQGANWLYRKVRPDRGHWVAPRQVPPPGDTMAYIPYVNRPDLLQQAVGSLRALWPWLVVIDHSVAGDAATVVADMLAPGQVFRSDPALTTFAQLQNWAIAEARERQAAYLLFLHTDASCPPAVPLEVLATARAHADVGAVFTQYDALAVFRLTALLDTGPWDESFRWYYADRDYYCRMARAGWAILEQRALPVRHLTSQTLATDPLLAQQLHGDLLWHAAHYQHKWGGPPGQERFRMPYNGHPW